MIFKCFLEKESPAMAANLEQGNIQGEAEISSEVRVVYAFDEGGAFFYQYLNEKKPMIE